MAQLPPDGDWLVQQHGGIVEVLHRHSGEVIVSFDPTDGDATARAQGVIHHSDRLNDEQKCFAHFWCGYFYANR